MTDLFGEFVSDAQIDRVFWAMAWNQRHTHQVLTKRADRMLAYCAGMAALTPQQRAIRMVNSGRFFNLPADTPTSGVPWPLPNVWLGVSVENQEWADKRIPDLLRTQAAKRFISAEPLLGPVSLGRWTEEGIECSQCKWFGVEEQARRVDDPVDDWWYACPKCGEICAHTPGDELLGEGINWVIVGGESGHGARQCRVEWIESIRDQCKEWGVACFVKQLGAYPIWAGAKCLPIEPARGKCDNPLEWPESLRVQQFPL